MSNSTFGYGDNYPPVSNRTQTSQSTHQNFPTSNATSTPYYGLQGSEAAGKAYSSSDHQYGQYTQTGTSSTGNLDNWGNYRTSSGTGAYSTGGLESVEQRLVNATRAPAQSAYDSNNLANLSYGSNLTYQTAAEAEQPASDYSATSLYSGTTQNTTTQRNAQYDQAQTQPRPVATTQRLSPPASQGQRQAAEPTPRTNTTASYNLPTPSPTYPQGLINPYPGNAFAGSLARSTTVPNVRANETSTAQTSAQQPSYTQTTSYGFTQQSRASRLSPEQMRKTQTPTPPVPPIRMATPETSTTAYRSQISYQQPAQNTQAQNARETRARTQPGHASSLKQAPVNVIMPSVGRPQTSPKIAPIGQRDMYQPQQSSVPTAQSRSMGNFRPDSSRASAMYQQQQTESRSQSAQDQPTSVDPSLVYNRYHEYQQQIKEAEAEAARLAKIEEEKKAAEEAEEAEEAEKRRLKAARVQKGAEAARIEKQRKQQEAKAAREAKAADKLRKKNGAEAAAVVEAAQTLAQTISHQTNFRMNAPQEVQEGEGEEEEEYMEVQAGNENDEDYVEEEQRQQRQHNQSYQQHVTPAHKPILPPQYQSTPQSRPPQQSSTETPANNDDLTATMEDEMRKTVERLRDFQAKDPKLFLKVWSSVRKSVAGPGQSPQPNGEGSQTQQSPALGNTGIPAQPPLSYAAGQSNQGNTHQNDATAPLQLLPVPPPILKKKPGRKPKKALETQAQATQNQEPQIPAPQISQFAGLAADFVTNEVLAPGESIMMRTETPHMPPRKRKPGRPSNAEKALREMQQQNQELSVKRKPGRPKGSKTKVQNAAAGEAEEEPPVAAPPTPPMQSAGPGSFGRLVPSAPSADPATRAAYSEQSQQGLQVNNAASKSTSMSNVPQPGPSETTTSTLSAAQQRGPTPAPKSATTATMEQAKAAPIAAATSQNQTAQWPDEHIDLIADTGSKLLNSLPQNTGKTMESATIREMLRTNPSYVQVCEMIEKKGFYMDRSKFARTLLAVISPTHAVAAQPQISQASSNAGKSNQAQQSTPQRSLSSAAAAVSAHKQSLAAAPPKSQAQPASALGSSRPYAVYQPPKYGGIESGTRPLEAGSFVREGTAQSQGSAKLTAAEKGKYASPYQSLRPDELDDFVPPTMNDDDDRDQHQLSFWQAYNKSASTEYRAPYGQQQNQTTSSGSVPLTNGQTVAQGSYLGNGVWGANSNNKASQNTPQQRLYPYQSQFSSQNGPASAPQGKPPQLSHMLPPQNVQTPSRGATPARPWNTGGTGMKRLHSEAFNSNKPFRSQIPSSYRPKPWGGRINSASEIGARAPNPFDASPFRVSSTTPQPQMPTQSSQKTYQAIYTQPYLQVNTVEEVSQQQISKNPLLNYDGIVLPIDTSIARRRSRYNPKTIARDVLISTGRHPSERSLNAHLEILKNFKSVENQSDLSTFRWDIVDPGGDEVESANIELREKMAASRAGPTPSRGNLSSLSSQPKTPSGLRNETIEIEDDDDRMKPNDDALAVPQSLARSGLAFKEGTTTPGRRPGREARNPAPNYKGMTAAELKGIQHDAGRRHREYSEQTPSEAARKPRTSLHYVEFACKWEGCDHVLLNLATLKRHVFTLHGHNDDVVQQGKVCMWHGCGNKDYSAENEETPGTYFDRLKDFKQHMEDTHLNSVARLYGDGPKSDVYDNDSDFDSNTTSSYLFDSETWRQVTPSVSGQKVERGNATHINGNRVMKIKREQKRKDAILRYWNIENFEHEPVNLGARKSTGGLSKECMGRFLRAQKRLEEEYGAELLQAAKESEGLGERGKKRVYAHDMPKALRKKLVVD